MARKSLFVVLTIITICLFCGTCFAAENNSINLGNEIMDSIHKTGNSINNVVSGNVVKDAGNTMKGAVNNVGGTMNNAGRGVQNGVNNVKNNVENMGNNMHKDNVNRTDRGNYNTIRTEVQKTASNTGLNTMTTTTWMWIILVVAAVIIIAAIWYYATQKNS